jgi:hypothetical protein
MPQATHPGYAPGAVPGGPSAPAPKSSGGKGCLVVLIVFLVIGVVGAIAAVAGIAWLGNKVDSGEAFGKTECDFVSNQDVSTVMGQPYELIQLGGLTAIATPALDARVLGDAKTCWATTTSSSSSGPVVRIARSDDGDAAARYDKELTQAKGVTEDRGNGLSVSSSSYLNKELSGVGDEAFCTTSDLAGSAGVLVRNGTKLVYVSIGLDSATTPSADLNGAQNGQVKFSSDDANCERAQKIAAKVN